MTKRRLRIVCVVMACAGILPFGARAQQELAETLKVLSEEFKKKKMPPESPLLRASKKGHIKSVRKALVEGADVSQAHPVTGMTPLLAALRYGHEDVAKLLLDQGAPVNVNDLMGFTPLMYAISNNDHGLAGLILAKGADMNAVSKQGLSAVSCAVTSGNAELINRLVSYGANINVKDSLGYTPLGWAVMSGDEHIVHKLLNLGADPRVVMEGDMTAADLATKIKRDDLSRLLSTTK